MINNFALLDKLNQLLLPQNYQDYCPNGMQVEGQTEIDTIITGVSISEALIDTAIAKNAQAIIVHHGLFWNKDSYVVTGIKKRRLENLLKHGINLYAYHLPLDNQPDLGNNVELAKLLEIKISGNTGEQNLLWYGELTHPTSLSSFTTHIENTLQHKPLCFAGKDTTNIRKVAWCTGGADSFFMQAIELGVDVYISGEAAEPTMNLAHESGVAYIAAGHYATERYGIMALTKHLHTQFGINAEFIELYNPV